MSARDHILTIDQGTTSTKALVLNGQGEIVGSSQGSFPITAHHPDPDWVQFDPVEIWQSVRDAAVSAVGDAGLGFEDLAGMGLANQGETVIAFDGRTGEPIGPAISWQDRRSEDIVERWRSAGLETMVQQRTGLRLDPYFSVSKWQWILENLPDAGWLLQQDRLRMGTSDTWIIWRLTGGSRFVTDAATASRTMLMELADRSWDSELAAAFGLPSEILNTALPRIIANDRRVGTTHKDVFGIEVPLSGLCVDQPAALFGQGCYYPNEAKATYGTGCFLLTHAGSDPALRAKGLLTSVGWQLGDETAYVFDGGVYCAGLLVGWLKKLGLVRDETELEQLVGGAGDSGGVFFIPALSGLAAPHWRSRTRACWAGMSSGTERRHLVRAAVESIAFRVREIVDSMAGAGVRINRLKVDGGLSRSGFLMQYQADLINTPLDYTLNPELAARGVGLMAGLGVGLWSWPDGLPERPRNAGTYEPRSDQVASCQARYERWRRLCFEVIRSGETAKSC